MSLGPDRSDAVAPPAPAGAATGQEPTRQLSVAGTSDHCVNCGAPLASDQRYCVTCGERRGKSRFSLATPSEEPAQTVTTTTSSSATPRRPRTSAGFNLIAGIATLLLAMGVGVLIGHNNSATTTKQAAAPAITINGGGAGTSTGAAAPSGATGSGAAGTGSAKKSKKAKATKAAKSSAPSKVVIQKAAEAASKVTGGDAKTADPTAQQGSKCSNDTAGCQNGKLTGNYFGQ